MRACEWLPKELPENWSVAGPLVRVFNYPGESSYLRRDGLQMTVCQRLTPAGSWLMVRVNYPGQKRPTTEDIEDIKRSFFDRFPLQSSGPDMSLPMPGSLSLTFWCRLPGN